MHLAPTLVFAPTYSPSFFKADKNELKDNQRKKTRKRKKAKGESYGGYYIAPSSEPGFEK